VAGRPEIQAEAAAWKLPNTGAIPYMANTFSRVRYMYMVTPW
jgi:hypothetical protein